MLVPPGSPLLHCLQQLNDDVWAQVLLPKLIANKSAHAVALTCTQLRSLCQRSHQQLDLTGLASEGTDTVSVKAYTETLAQHFPSCNAVKLLLSHSHGYVVTPCILEALSRLRGLQVIELVVKGDANEVAMAMVLVSMQEQLPQLRTLTLQLHQNWASADLVWQQLYRTTQLTKLIFTGCVKNCCQNKQLAGLRSLEGLQHLAICTLPQQRQPDDPPVSMGFVSGLTALTYLSLPIWTNDGLEAVSSLKNLKGIALRYYGRSVSLEHQWAAIGQLTGLTRMYVSGRLRQRMSEAFLQALACLKHLDSADPAKWCYDALPILSQLTQLRVVKGAWEDGVPDPDSLCSSVITLDRASGNVPLCAFPKLRYLYAAGSFHAQAVYKMSGCCKELERIGMSGGRSVRAAQSFFDAVTQPAAVRMAAIQGLSQLQLLTNVSFCPADDLELAMLAQSLPRVPKLVVARSRNSLMTSAGLMSLAQLTSLQNLSMAVWDMPLTVEAAQLLLATHARVPEVWIGVVNSDLPGVVEQAVEANREAGLGVPQGLEIEALSL